jgi:hypothetical protein
MRNREEKVFPSFTGLLLGKRSSVPRRSGPAVPSIRGRSAPHPWGPRVAFIPEAKP